MLSVLNYANELRMSFFLLRDRRSNFEIFIAASSVLFVLKRVFHLMAVVL